MTEVRSYAGAGIVLVGTIVLALWPFLDGADRLGIVTAAAVAYPVQILAFLLLVRHRHEMKRFLVVWIGGTALRMALVGAVALLVIRGGGPPPLSTLLALAGFFFVLLLLEPFFFRRTPSVRAAGA